MSSVIMPPEYTTERFVPSRFEAEHTTVIRGQEIVFSSVSEDYVFYGEGQEAEASIFSISYIRKPAGSSSAAPLDDAVSTFDHSDIPSNGSCMPSGHSGVPSNAHTAGRPVMFFWNGGPGSATSMLHLECFGPWLIQKDSNGNVQYGIEAYNESILDLCDLVFVDPVGVGYSRLLDQSQKEKYYSVDGDARSIAFFIAEWIRRNGRWNDPIYICGESYGTIRACRVLAELGRSPYSESRKVLGIPVAGVILIGSAISLSADGMRMLEPGMELVTAMMPAMAATNWYHHPEGKGSQKDFVDSAWNFMKNELLGALFEGDDCSEERLNKDAAQLSFYTGMPESYFIRNHLHVQSEEDFCMQVASDLGCRVDIYDSRVLIPLSGPYNAIGNANNIPLAVMNGILAPKLGINMDRLYYTGNLTVNPYWNYDTEDLPLPFGKKTHIQCLKHAMQTNPDMKVLFASGLYDICTHAGNTRYMLAHSGLPKDQLIVREYPGGHGVYSSEEGKQMLFKDVRSLLQRN